MDISGIVAVVMAIFAVGKSLYTGWRQNKMERENQIIWEGKIGRGFAEVMFAKFMVLHNGVWEVNDAIRMQYEEKLPEFFAVYSGLRKRFHRQPTAAEFTWVVEHTSSLQNWLVDNICRNIGIRDYGCLAIAYVLADQYEEPPK